MVDYSKEYDEALKLVKKGNASNDALMYLGSYFQKKSEILWNKFLMCDRKLEDFVALQGRAQEVSELNRVLVMDAMKGKQAEAKMKLIMEAKKHGK